LRLSCIICGSKESRLLWNKKGHDFVKCLECGLIYVKGIERKREIFSSAVPKYQEHLREGLAREILSLSKGGRLLDLGCGTGAYSAPLISRGFDIYGVEPNTATLAYGVKHFGIKGFNGYIEDAPFPDDFFDIAVMNEVVEHLTEPEVEFSKLRHLLKRGGILFVKTGACQHNKDFGPDWRYCEPCEHYYFTLNLLKRLVKKHGFKVISERNLVAGSGCLRVWAENVEEGLG